MFVQKHAGVFVIAAHGLYIWQQLSNNYPQLVKSTVSQWFGTHTHKEQWFGSIYAMCRNKFDISSFLYSAKHQKI